jgi:hypothetical protein
MKIIIFGFLIAFAFISCYSIEVESTEIGGNWNDTQTWISGTIPTQNDDVIIRGNVKINTNISCKSINIANVGNLEFMKQEKKTISSVSENIYIFGMLIISENCEVNVKNRIFRDENNKPNLMNFGVIVVGT